MGKKIWISANAAAKRLQKLTGSRRVAKELLIDAICEREIELWCAEVVFGPDKYNSGSNADVECRVPFLELRKSKNLNKDMRRWSWSAVYFEIRPNSNARSKTIIRGPKFKHDQIEALARDISKEPQRGGGRPDHPTKWKSLAEALVKASLSGVFDRQRHETIGALQDAVLAHLTNQSDADRLLDGSAQRVFSHLHKTFFPDAASSASTGRS